MIKKEFCPICGEVVEQHNNWGFQNCTRKLKTRDYIYCWGESDVREDYEHKKYSCTFWKDKNITEVYKFDRYNNGNHNIIFSIPGRKILTEEQIEKLTKFI